MAVVTNLFRAALLAQLVILSVFASTAQSTFHLLQIEQVMVGVNGDTTAQAIQLRLRENGEFHTSDASLSVYDQLGFNKYSLISEFPGDVANEVIGDRVLIVTPNFANYTDTTLQPDFYMNPIPVSYLSAGRITYENYLETVVFWSFAYGGEAYLGPTTGALENDPDGDFGVFPTALPTSGVTAARFTGSATDASTSNSTDYVLTSGPTVWTNNAGQQFTVSPVVGDTRTWANNGTENWGTGSNWSPAAPPDSNTHSVVFGNAITGPTTVFTNTPVTAKEILFSSAQPYAIAGQGSVNLDADTGNAIIDVDQGIHQFQATVNLLDNTSIDIASGASLTFNNELNLGGKTLTTTGAGSLIINGRIISGGGSITGTDGVISGNGEIAADLANHGATVAPGNSSGILSVAGSYSQFANGLLEIELGGLQAGTEYDRLAISGTATINGSIKVDFVNGFQAARGDTFDVIVAASILDLGYTLVSSSQNELRLQSRIVDLNTGGQALQILVVPEPSNILMLVFAVFLFVTRGRSARVSLAIVLSLASPTLVRSDVIAPISATANGSYSDSNGDRVASLAINGAGLNPNPADPITALHSEAAPIVGGHGMWLSQEEPQDSTPAQPAFITFDLGATYELTGLHVWNFSERHYGCCELTGRGVKDANVYADIANPNPTTFVQSFVFSKAVAIGNSPTQQNGWGTGYVVPGQTYNFTNPVTARYVTIDALTNHLVSSNVKERGLAEVRFIGTFLPPATATWNVNNSGSWNTASNWLNSFNTTGVPNSNRTLIVLNNVIQSPQTVVADSNVVTKGIEFNSPYSYAIAGLGQVILDTDTGNASLNVTQGSHEFQAVVSLQDDLQTTVAAGADLTFRNRIILNGRTMTVGAGSRIRLAHGLVAAGTGSLNNEGTLASNSPSAINGNLNSTGLLDVEIGGANAGEFGNFKVSGTASLSGLLSVTLAEGYIPTNSERFTILTASALTDNGITLTGPDASSFTLSSFGNKLVLTTGLAGDYNSDGAVNSADYVMWRKTLGSTTTLIADGDDSGIVDAADYDFWRKHIGRSQTEPISNLSDNSIPEPNSGIVFLMLAVTAAVVRRY